MDESEADKGDEVVAEVVLSVAYEGDDEDAPMLLQGTLLARAVVVIEGKREVVKKDAENKKK